ncbi:MAG: hypothetical protein JNG89_08710 [Planctomycetaceae bacterium]|nr:hypothetical protein [Planctomycetaceae bacterium]
MIRSRLAVQHAAGLTAAAVFGFMLSCSGCGQSPPAGSSAPAETVAEEHAHEHDHEHGAEGHEHSHDAADIEAAMAKLSPEDRALAEAQKVCVVSKEPLGTMGAPIKVEHDDEVAFLCCEGCRDAFEADPHKYLTALHEAEATGADAAAVPDEAAKDAATAEPATAN